MKRMKVPLNLKTKSHFICSECLKEIFRIMLGTRVKIQLYGGHGLMVQPDGTRRSRGDRIRFHLFSVLASCFSRNGSKSSVKVSTIDKIDTFTLCNDQDYAIQISIKEAMVHLVTRYSIYMNCRCCSVFWSL